MDELKVIIELTVFTVGIYLILRFLRETRGSGVVRGLIIVLLGGMVAFFTLIRTLELERLDVVFKEVTATIVLGLVIVFHQEIRRAFVQLGDSQIFGRFFRREVKTIQRLLRSVARLSKERIGALIAIEREGSLANLAETGVHIDAELNSFLIESIFYPGTALHDGAIVIRGDRLVAASCLLPLSQNQDIDKRLGTRHRAAVGLTEESDALAIVVSEETGKISTSVGGKLDYGISLEQLEKAIEEHQKGRTVSSTPKERRSRAFLLREIFSDPYRKLIAVGLAIVLWVYLDGQVTQDGQNQLDLQASTSSTLDALSEGDNTSVQVRVTDRRYSILGFEDGSNPLSSVLLHTSGTNSELADLDTDLQAIWVELDTKPLTDPQEKLQIRLGDLKVRPAGLKKYIDRMEPPTVEVNLILNNERLQNLTPDIVSYSGDDGRLIKQEALFIPEQVTLRGPAEELERFLREPIKFIAELDAAAGPSGRRSGLLRLVGNYSGITMEPDGVFVKVAEKPDYEPFEFRVPVKAIDTSLTEAQRASYSIQDSILLRFDAASTLASRLKAEADTWMFENAVVTVWLEPSHLVSGGSVAGQLFLKDPQYRPGTHFAVDASPLVKITLKDQ